jgi:transposase
MLNLLVPGEIFLCMEATDMRKSFDSLLRLAEDYAARNALDGGLFVFLSRRRDRVKLLYWNEDGLAIWYKRLEQGTFELPAVPSGTRCVMLSASELALLLGGIELASVRRRQRYERPARRETA